jgi:hypothetical protein
MTDAEPGATARDDGRDPTGSDDGDGASGSGPRGRDVEVPFEVYKVVTVFSTLFAIGTVVVGFVLLDWGTNRATADLSDVNVGITLAGLGCIALGAGTYAFSTRFRARGMGNAKDGAD